MNKKADVIVVGYGSIGKRHVKNLNQIGIKPYILTQFPDNENAFFCRELPTDVDFEYAIIASPTDRHLSDLLEICKSGCRKILIEKPIEINLKNSMTIYDIANSKRISIFCGYNLRYIKALKIVKNIIDNIFKEICIVQITCGQYLPEWRQGIDYKNSYSSIRKKGGGADLDISHEIDYMSWLFGYPEEIVFIKRDNLSNLCLSSPDYFFGMYRYRNFICNVELDYIRKKERKLRIIGENKIILDIDFIKKKFKVNETENYDPSYFDLDNTYMQEIEEFLGLAPKKYLATIEDSLNVIKLLKL